MNGKRDDLSGSSSAFSKLLGGCVLLLVAALFFTQPAFAVRGNIDVYNPIEPVIISVAAWVCMEDHRDILVFRGAYLTQWPGVVETEKGIVKINYFATLGNVSVYRAESKLPLDKDCPAWAMATIPNIKAMLKE